MKNHEGLNVKYIIWGQRIWNPSQDEQTEWTSWRGMDDRGDITQNHWYDDSLHSLKDNPFPGGRADEIGEIGITSTSASTKTLGKLEIRGVT